MINHEWVQEKKIFKLLNQYFQISLGVFLLTFAFYFFMNPLRLVCGGMFGIATIIHPLIKSVWIGYEDSYFLYTMGIITLILGRIFLGRDFFLKTVFATLFSPTIELIFEKTNCDPMFILNTINEGSRYLIAVILSTGLAGLGIGICIKNNGCTGGMDVVQRIMSKYLKIPMSFTMYLTDWIIVLFSGFSFIGGFSYNIEYVVYGIIVVYGMSYIIDMFAMNARSRRTVYTITTIPHEIKELIYANIDRGVTIIDVVGGYSGENKTMIVCTMEKNEAYRCVDLIKSRDPSSFTFVTSCKEVAGEFTKRKII